MTYENAMRFFRYDPFPHIPREQATVGALRAEAIGVDTDTGRQGTSLRQAREHQDHRRQRDRLAGHDRRAKRRGRCRRGRPGRQLVHWAVDTAIAFLVMVLPALFLGVSIWVVVIDRRRPRLVP